MKFQKNCFSLLKPLLIGFIFLSFSIEVWADTGSVWYQTYQINEQTLQEVFALEDQEGGRKNSIADCSEDKKIHFYKKPLNNDGQTEVQTRELELLLTIEDKTEGYQLDGTPRGFKGWHDSPEGEIQHTGFGGFTPYKGIDDNGTPLDESDDKKIPLDDGFYLWCASVKDTHGAYNYGNPSLYVYNLFEIRTNQAPEVPDHPFIAVPEGKHLSVKNGATILNTSNFTLNSRFVDFDVEVEIEPEVIFTHQKCSLWEQFSSSFQFGKKTCEINGRQGVQICIMKNDERVWSECEVEEANGI